MQYKNIRRKIMANGYLTVTTEAVVYTVPAGKQAEASIRLYNSHTSGVSIEVFLKKSGASTSYPIYKNTALATLTAQEINGGTEPLKLDAGDVISAKAGTANKLNVTVHGTEYTLG